MLNYGSSAHERQSNLITYILFLGVFYFSIFFKAMCFLFPASERNQWNVIDRFVRIPPIFNIKMISNRIV